jgi:UDP-glucose:(heptosyl)LPS alpha-1,3-glucosyltransferase
MKGSHLTIGFLRRGYSSTGGVESYLKGLAQGLLKEGHRPVLFGTGAWPASEWPGGEILRCNSKALSYYATEVERHKESSGIKFDLTLSVEKVPGCDIYRTDEGVHAAWLDQRAPHITPWARVFQKISPKHREKLRLEKELFKSIATRRVISLSERISDDIKGYYGYPNAQITLIRNGVSGFGSPSLQCRENARKELGVSSEQKIVLFVGTGWERKGLRFAIHAVEKMSDPRVILLVAGKGRQSRYASPVIRFLGPVRNMERVYAAADLLVAPSLYEPFSLVALEALSAGVPVMTSKVAGVSEIMTQGLHGGIIDHPSDVASLSLSLREWLTLLEDPVKASASRSACVELASRFSLERNLLETLAVIGEVIQEKGSS